MTDEQRYSEKEYKEIKERRRYEKRKRQGYFKEYYKKNKERVSIKYIKKGYNKKSLLNLKPAKKGNLYHWKGGRWTNKLGRTFVYVPNHPFANKNGYVMEHRLVMGEHLGRFLSQQEVVHHLDGNPNNNNINNLHLFRNESKHRTHHNILIHAVLNEINNKPSMECGVI